MDISPISTQSKSHEERKFDDKSDAASSQRDGESASDTTNRESNIPYAYFFRFIDKVRKAEDDKIDPGDILNAWKLGYDADNNNEEKEVKHLRYELLSLLILIHV